MIHRFIFEGLARTFGTFDSNRHCLTKDTSILGLGGWTDVHWEHQNVPEGRNIGKCEIVWQPHGLEVKGMLRLDTENALHKDILELIAKGRVRGLSIGYCLGEADYQLWQANPDGYHVWREIEMFEISICAHNGGDSSAKISYLSEIS
jgi:HK97 family phage prohead protease